MNEGEFFRQAQYLRDYSPTITSISGGALSAQVVRIAKFLIIGRFVIAYVQAEFTINAAAPAGFYVTMPTLIKVGASYGGMGTHTGFSQDGTGADFASVGVVVSAEPTKMIVRKYDFSVFATGALGAINGLFFYENGEPVV